MIRNIVKIDEEKCNGCGLCINACHEGALRLINGKARLITDSYCDGLGACLPGCPQNAMIIEEREADFFDEETVKKRMALLNASPSNVAPIIDSHVSNSNCQTLSQSGCGCPGSAMRKINRPADNNLLESTKSGGVSQNPVRLKSRLSQWPLQIKLVNPQAPYFSDCHLLVAADCVGFAYANLQEDFIKDKTIVIGCPKLDSQDYSDKLSEIIKYNEIKSITVLQMEVPCCGGMGTAAKQALDKSGKTVPLHIVIIGLDGEIIER